MNYPDDIRCFDDHPQSPYYSGDDEQAERLAEEWENEINETGLIAEAGFTIEDLHGELAENGKDLKDLDAVWKVVLRWATEYLDAFFEA